MNSENDKIIKLKDKIEAIESKQLNETKPKRDSNVSFGFKISTELVAAVVVGGTMGFLLDSWFDTKPLLTISFFFMCAVAGILNVFRSAKRMNKEL